MTQFARGLEHGHWPRGNFYDFARFGVAARARCAGDDLERAKTANFNVFALLHRLTERREHALYDQ